LRKEEFEFLVGKLPELIAEDIMYADVFRIATGLKLVARSDSHGAVRNPR
jgi:hypothetical protein